MSAQSAPTPSAIDTRLHPFAALKAVRRLLDNPDDTTQVFVILKAMRGRSGIKMFRRFRASATGAAILRERRALLPALRDHRALAALPAGSLGRVYLDFMRAEHLSAEGLVAPSRAIKDEGLSSDVLLFRDRMRDMHDLTHVLTGYGRDPLGELCLLAFMYAQTGNPGQAMIVLMGLARGLRTPYGKIMRRAVFQAWRHGRRAAWMPQQDWEALLAQPLETLRRDLAVAAPTQYPGGGVMSGVAAMPAEAPQRSGPAGLVPLMRSLAINLLGPYLLYRAAEGYFPAKSIAPLLISALVPIGEFAVVFARKRAVDVVAIISIAMLAANLAIAVAAHSVHAALIGRACQAAVLGLVFGGSLLIGRPLIVPLARLTLAGDDPARQARFDSIAATPAARHSFALITWIWTAGLCLETVLLLLALKWLTPPDYLLFSNVFSLAVMALLIWGSVRFGRRAAR
jgi:ubiquinone biosynthesis protein COQ4